MISEDVFGNQIEVEDIIAYVDPFSGSIVKAHVVSVLKEHITVKVKGKTIPLIARKTFLDLNEKIARTAMNYHLTEGNGLG